MSNEWLVIFLSADGLRHEERGPAPTNETIVRAVVPRFPSRMLADAQPYETFDTRRYVQVFYDPVGRVSIYREWV